MKGTIPKRISMAIINSLSAGVVPRVGLEYVAVGRKREIETILGDLENLSQGAAAFRFITGRYGSGKSFFLQAIRNFAMEKNFVVADADLSPEKRLSGSANQGLETYRELMQRLSTRLRPDGGALEGILQGWINAIKAEIIAGGVSPQDETLVSRVEWRIFETISKMEGFAHGYDFATAVSVYYKAFMNDEDEKKHGAIKWLRGEYATKTEARSLLPVGEIITDENWYEYIKLFAAFSAQLGYRGLLLFIDECVNLYKISHRQSRENNYEKLLSMFNEVMQGKVRHLGIYLAGTPQFVEDERRGLFSYPALKSRLADSRFVREGLSDFNRPIIRLAQLSREEIYVLLERLTAIHAGHFGYESRLGEAELTAFMRLAFSTPGAAEFITPREITRDFLSLLNILMEDPRLDFNTLVNREDFAVTGPSPEEREGDLYASFDL
ncbi:MAG: ATP-binding protein [Spirochaetaceae bacterium]|nr:ATP-binding protein [Spirochaetaceae bacterium]